MPPPKSEGSALLLQVVCVRAARERHQAYNAMKQWYRALASHVYRHFIRWIACMALPPQTAVMRVEGKLCLKQVATIVMRKVDENPATVKVFAVGQLVRGWQERGLMWPPTVDFRTLHDFV